MDWRKILLPLIITAAISITATVYGISIVPRIANNEQGIFRLMDMVIEIRKDMATKEDVKELKALIKEVQSDSPDR